MAIAAIGGNRAARRGMATPWGSAQRVDRVTPDGAVIWVSTAGHGGLMMSFERAARHLSGPARDKGDPFDGGWLCYEEDCRYAIPLSEFSDELLSAYMDGTGRKAPHDLTARRASLLATISAWDADYLIERGIKPEPAAFEFWQAGQDEDKLRRAKSPDLIVSACSSWFDRVVPPGCVGVYTADGAYHLVTAESYRARTGRRLNLLSLCEMVIT